MIYTIQPVLPEVLLGAGRPDVQRGASPLAEDLRPTKSEPPIPKLEPQIASLKTHVSVPKVNWKHHLTKPLGLGSGVPISSVNLPLPAPAGRREPLAEREVVQEVLVVHRARPLLHLAGLLGHEGGQGQDACTIQ